VTITKALDKIDSIVNQIDFETLHIEIKTKDCEYTLDKTKEKIYGFSVKGGEAHDI
jgi:hypothetical protein